MKHKADQTQLKNAPLTPLHAAAMSGHKSVVKMLLKNGASIASEDFDLWTPLHYAALQGRTDLIKLLFKVGCCTKTLQTPLHLAAYSGNIETVKVVLECEEGVINNEDVFGCTPLYLAAFRGNADTVELLIRGKNFA